MFTVFDECGAQFFFSPVTLATELFAYNYLGQQQFCIYHFYAFYIKNKFNNCFVSWASAYFAQMHACMRLKCDMHASGSNFRIMSSTLLSCVLQPTHISSHSLPDGSDLLLYRFSLDNNDGNKKHNDDSVLCLKCPLNAHWMNGEKTFWIFHLHFRDSPINHTHHHHSPNCPGWAENELCIIFFLSGFFWWNRIECNLAPHMLIDSIVWSDDNVWRRYVIRYKFKSHFFLLAKRRSFSFSRCIATDLYIAFQWIASPCVRQRWTCRAQVPNAGFRKN